MKNRELDKIIKLIASKIEGTEFENHTYVVGGFVRDLLLRNERNDLDFVVNLPQGGIKLATFLYKKRLSYRPVIYKRFGTAMVQMRGHKIEFVMTRVESYEEKSRHPEVGFASLQEDAFRRDFTINAIYYNISNRQIQDITGLGRADLEKKLIRSTSNPDLIFQEDPLRILRAVRFAARLNFSIEEKTLQGIIQWRDSLQHISIERIKDEFINMILHQRFSQALQICFETKIVKYILPPLVNRQKESLKLTEKIDIYPPDLTIRLALLSLAVDDFEAMEKAIIKLTINKKLARKSILIARNVRDLLNFTQIKHINKLVFNNLTTLLLALDIMKISFPEFDKHKLIVEKIELFTKYPYPLNGKDIIDRLCLHKNQEIKYFTRLAKDVWVENPEMGKEEILAKIELINNKNRV